MSLTRRQQVFVAAYLRTLVGAAAAREAGCSERSARSQASRWLADADVQAAIRQGLAERGVSPDSVLARLADQANGDLGRFFRVVECWTEYPLPTQEPVLDAEGSQVTRSVVLADGVAAVQYRVRQVVLDTARLVDPTCSRLVKRFSDSPRAGLSIELYDAQAALVQLGKHLGLFVERTEITGANGEPLLDVRAELERKLARLAATGDQASVPGESE